MKLGAEKWIDFRESKNIVEDVMAATDGQGPHAALVAAVVVSSGSHFSRSCIYNDRSQAAPFNQAVDYLRQTGTLVAVGMPVDAKLAVPITTIVGKVSRCD